jgi:exo-rhamnogalacturonan lyase-like protein
MTRELAIPLLVSSPQAGRVSRNGEPVTAGVPFPRSAAHGQAEWVLQSEDGTLLPMQMRVLDRWPDGSIRWTLVDTRVTVVAGTNSEKLLLRRASTGNVPSREEIVTVVDAPEMFVIDTGVASFRLSADAPIVLARVDAAGRMIFDGGRSELAMRGPAGEAWPVRWGRPSIEVPGSQRVGVVTRGSATHPSGARVDLDLRFDFYAGLSVVRARLTVRNARRARHPKGVWQLGDAGSVLLKELSLILRTMSSEASRIHWSLDSKCWGVAAQTFQVYQDSSGGDNWLSANHVNRQGAVPLRFSGYEGCVDGRRITGARATPIVSIERPSGHLGAAVPRFWENFPRALTVAPSTLTVSFFPPDSSDLHELQGGEQKTHECYLLFGYDGVTEQPLEWCRSRLVLHPTPEWFASSGVVQYLVTRDCDDAGYRSLVDAAIEGGDTFLAKRERADEYGWRHFGDIYGDHEAVFHKGSSPLMSHYNNQYDAVAGFFYQFAKTGDLRWWTQCIELAAHVVDVDIYHTDQDKSAYNHGLFWHTHHYLDAGKATHRGYPTGTNGGGPSSEHNYTTGLMLHYFVTGNPASRDAALGLAKFVIDMDDGKRTVFRWLDRGDTGVASASRSSDYHGPGRGSGNSLNALLDGHRLSGDRKYLEKAEQIIRRSTHPHQNIEALELLDPENRWFYTMYLQSLGKYLDWKIELGELDAMYAYGRDTLLHFARWMTDHERPYLSRPELLEYPTETWVAQDIRKSEILEDAARYADATERARFLERAEFFFDNSIATLQMMPTRTLTRPVVLLLSHGFRHAHTKRHGIEAAPPPIDHWFRKWPHPESFVPQKTRARQRGLRLAVTGAALGLGALAKSVFR